ncbi:MAG: gamma-glutamyltransferase family protein [Burkholderiaceae bacterium]
MTNAFFGRRGMAVAPHSLAAESAINILREGGNALEATVSAAATIAVVYPHMNAIGGDAFWVMRGPNGQPGGIDASGPSAAMASIAEYNQRRGIATAIPFRGANAALTVAGTIGGWIKALEISKQLGGRLPVHRLLEDAIWLAEHGVPVTESQAKNTIAKCEELREVPGFAETFLVNDQPPAAGSLFKQPRLAQTFKQLARRGLDDFYRGQIARDNAADLGKLGSPLRLADFKNFSARLVNPLEVQVASAALRNMRPPSQGLISLLILAIMDRVLEDHPEALDDPCGARFIHLQVEATKLAFRLRDAHLTDPAYMSQTPESFLTEASSRKLASEINLEHAAPWGNNTEPGGTIWMGVIDQSGIAISFIQSIYHEFGSGIVLPTTGVNWQNRGCSFSLDPAHVNCLAPGKRPFHTLNAGLAELPNGGTMVYGSMGGDGQPQTQATLFTRMQHFGLSPQQAIELPRWLLGRTWGNRSESLKLEARFSSEVFTRLSEMGHLVERIGPWDESVGHAGAIVRHAHGVLEGGFDPRSNGGVAAF